MEWVFNIFYLFYLWLFLSNYNRDPTESLMLQRVVGTDTGTMT